MADHDAPDSRPLGVIVVDHGSRRAESNAMLMEIAEWFQQQSDYEIVEPAHMELAEPSIATAFDRCVRRGAGRIVVFPYFLLPGRHWQQDIPELTAKAAERHHGIPFLVTAPFGRHPLMLEIMHARIEHCRAASQGDIAACDTCEFHDPPRTGSAAPSSVPSREPYCRLRKSGL